MNCSEFATSLHNLFIGEATPEEKKAVEAHARTCEKCKALLEVANELSCEEFVNFLGRYVDGALPIDRKEVFERHLAICAECTAYLATYRRAIEMARATGEDDAKNLVEKMPDDLVMGIVKSLKRQ